MPEEFVIDTYEKFLSAYTSLEAISRADAGATYKRYTETGQVEIVFYPEDKIEETQILETIKRCDFTVQRVVVWIDLNPEEQSARINIMIVPLAQLERMARALPEQPSDIDLMQAIAQFQAQQAQAIAEAEESVRQADLLYKLQPNTQNYQLVETATNSLQETKALFSQELEQKQQHQLLSLRVRELQQQLGWVAKPDETEKRQILGAVNAAVQNLEDIYRRS